ncbi:hypothetical protein C8T65DRAFT_694361 [Cerioporus squamosus]|nr:hypothetical protein C8T65DRAFT_694361 [Cerioporus squamosus]
MCKTDERMIERSQTHLIVRRSLGLNVAKCYAQCPHRFPDCQGDTTNASRIRALPRRSKAGALRTAWSTSLTATAQPQPEVVLEEGDQYLGAWRTGPPLSVSVRASSPLKLQLTVAHPRPILASRDAQIDHDLKLGPSGRAPTIACGGIIPAPPGTGGTPTGPPPIGTAPICAPPVGACPAPIGAAPDIGSATPDIAPAPIGAPPTGPPIAPAPNGAPPAPNGAPPFIAPAANGAPPAPTGRPFAAPFAPIMPGPVCPSAVGHQPPRQLLPPQEPLPPDPSPQNRTTSRQGSLLLRPSSPLLRLRSFRFLRRRAQTCRSMSVRTPNGSVMPAKGRMLTAAIAPMIAWRTAARPVTTAVNAFATSDMIAPCRLHKPEDAEEEDVREQGSRYRLTQWYFCVF